MQVSISSPVSLIKDRFDKELDHSSSEELLIRLRRKLDSSRRRVALWRSGVLSRQGGGRTTPKLSPPRSALAERD